MFRASIIAQAFVQSVETVTVGEKSFVVANLYATEGKDDRLSHHNPKLIVPKGVELTEGDRIKVTGTLKTSAYIGKDGSAKVSEQITYATVNILALGQPKDPAAEAVAELVGAGAGGDDLPF